MVVPPRVDESLLEMMKRGTYAYKHDFNRSKRVRKYLTLSGDGLSLRWKTIGMSEIISGAPLSPGMDSPGSPRTPREGGFGGLLSPRASEPSMSAASPSSSPRFPFLLPHVSRE